MGTATTRTSRWRCLREARWCSAPGYASGVWTRWCVAPEERSMPRPPTQETRPPPPAMPTADAPLTPSKTQRKRDAHALQALGVQLVALSVAQLARIELPEALHEAVVAAQRMRAQGARTRQLQYIGKLMRQIEPATLSRIRAVLAPRQADGQGLEPDKGGGHIASSSSQRTR